MAFSLENFSTHIILVGDFSPPLISPHWLLSQGLLGKSDAEFALHEKSYALTPEICRFETDWFSLQILPQQFALSSKGPVTPAIRDLFVGIFSLLSHTPLSGLGFNHHADYRMSSHADYHLIGDVFAPKDIWATFFPESQNQNVGLQQLTMLITPGRRGEPPETTAQKRVTIAPSNSISAGVQLIFNEHYPLDDSTMPGAKTPALAIKYMEEEFIGSMESAKELFNGLLTAALERRERNV